MSNNNSKQPPDNTATNSTHTMSNSNDKQLLEIAPLATNDKAQAPPTSTPTVKKLNYVGINLVGRSFRDIRPREKNDSIHIPGISKHDVTTPNLSQSDEASFVQKNKDKASTSNVDDETTIGFLLKSIERGDNRGNQLPPSICKVSRILRDDKESFFTPQLVSIGPIHRDDPKLQEFEWLKECFLADLLKRCEDSTPKKTLLDACLLEVNTLIPKIRESYGGVIKNYSNDKLARMMVMDACFILEFCFKHEKADLSLPNKMQNNRIAMDLMLLDNQVPFSVLQALFNCVMGEESFTLNYILDEYLAPYSKLFCSLLPEKNSTTDVDSALPVSTTDDHVLGYLYKRYQLVVAKSSNSIHTEPSKLADEEGIENTAFHSIVELERSGMKFKPHQEGIWSMTIKFQSPHFPCLPWFWRKPTLLMPTLVIDDITELILRNFIAYEQSFPQGRYYFTSYARAMDMLIDSQVDIAKLVKSKVLVNMLGTNQEAADMINKICRNISITDFSYTKAFKKMDKYYNGFWPKHIAMVRRVYFSNRWSAIALLGAIILFSLTVVQTIYTVVQTVYTIRAA